MKNLYVLLSMILLFILSGCAHEHKWQDASCIEPKYCVDCGEIEGLALGHDWIDATYASPQTCVRCGITEGGCLLHEVPKGFIDGYEFGDFNRYNSNASENGLEGSMIWVQGEYESVSTLDLPSVKKDMQAYFTIFDDDEGNQWMLMIDINEFSELNKYTELNNHPLCVLGRYLGWSGVYEVPVIQVEKIFDRATGNMIAPYWYEQLY